MANHQREGEEDTIPSNAGPATGGRRRGTAQAAQRQQHEPAGLCFFSSAGTHDT
mgnify:CR=1 FL=1